MPSRYMMSQAEFERLVSDGIDAIPEKFLKLLNNVAVVVEDEPTSEQRRRMRLGRTMTLFGLYEGIPQAKRGANYSWVAPDKITIFMLPILGAASSEAEVRAIVRDTVWHEIAHHFGMDEGRVRKAEAARHRRKAA